MCTQSSSTVMGEVAQEEGWVVCRIFKKKNHHKTLDSPVMSSGTVTMETTDQMTMFDSIGNEGALEQIFQYNMGKSACKEEETNNNESSAATENDNNDDTNDNNKTSTRFLPISLSNMSSRASMNMNNDFSNGCGYNRYFSKLPSLESPNSSSSQNGYQPMNNVNEGMIGDIANFGFNNHNHQIMDSNELMIMTNWATLDRLVASQLNGQTEASRQLACFGSNNITTNGPAMDYCTGNHDHLQVPPAPTLRSSSSSKPYRATQEYGNEMELWSTFARSSSTLSSSDPICHVSNAPS